MTLCGDNAVSKDPCVSPGSKKWGERVSSRWQSSLCSCFTTKKPRNVVLWSKEGLLIWLVSRWDEKVMFPGEFILYDRSRKNFAEFVLQDQRIGDALRTLTVFVSTFDMDYKTSSGDP